ncbi:MAG: DUF1553 domain-containing protein [Verrucomicrobiaceae bacterium]|nr:DUF1553 domain-containing protein [Verrucomicrobiaceae bacterium]
MFRTFVLILPTALLAQDGRVEFFEKKIRPVLAQECYECHSAAGKQKGGLLLDSRPGWQAGGDSGEAILPGNASASLLMQTIRHTHEDLKMPKNGAQLDPVVLGDFERWINEGAVDPRDQPPSAEEVTRDTDWKAVLERRKQWWAFQPPKVSRSDGLSMDHFVNEKLAEKGLQAAPRADDGTLMRRFHYVLTGLPPSVEESEAYLEACKTDRQRATRDLVDRLLESPRFGEKWARHWMDWVRYAESYGSEGDPPIPYAWRYRDYLIRAFNADVPYPQMVREAIAGDVLPNPRINTELNINESAIGIAQLRMVLHGFSPTDSLDEMVTFTDNQIDTVSKTFQAMTLSCARCHNHKFDALGQADFYAWFGVFSSTHPGVLDVNLPQQEVRAKLVSIKEQIRSEIGKSWLSAAKTLPKTPAKDASMGSVTQETWCHPKARAGDFSVALEGDRIIQRVYPAGMVSDLITDRERVVTISPTQKCEGGTLWVRCAGGGGARVRYIVQNYPRTGTIHKAIDLSKPEDSKFRWRKLDLEYWKGDDIFIECGTAADRPAEAQLDARSWFAISDVRFVQGDSVPADPEIGGDPVLAVQSWLNGDVTSEQATLIQLLLEQGKLPNGVEGNLGRLVEQYRAAERSLRPPTRVPGVLEDNGRDALLFTQGDHKRPAQPVARGFLEAIDPKPFATKGTGRLELANAINHPNNPLTNRVIVNRLWHHVFGQGLVSTVDNFGRLGKLPTHPELLDWLALEFQKSGGSMKQMIRRMVLTDAFARAAGRTDKDPDNLYLSAWKVRRLEAEAVRDTMLALSGQLEHGSPGEAVSGDSPRRSVYVQVIRNRLDPLLSVFDAPVPSATRGSRDATNVPAQALALMNDVGVKDWARSWASRVLADKSCSTAEMRVARMLNELTGRSPSASEKSGALALVTTAETERQTQAATLDKLKAEQSRLSQEVTRIMVPARTKLLAARSPAAVIADAPEPFAEWDFEENANDRSGKLPLKLHGGARVDGGALILDGNASFAQSVPLPQTIGAKTFEAWVQLDSLDQQGGGVMTLQDRRGEVFDSLVYAEKERGCWVAGSDHFRRSELFGGQAETEAKGRAVHVAIVWTNTGKTTGFRDGVMYGRPFNASARVDFKAGESELLLGCRHGSPSGNRLLKGRILRARLYDRALSAQEISRSSKVEQSNVSDKDVINALSPVDQSRIASLQKQIDDLERQLTSMRATAISSELDSWAALAQSLFSLKQMIYLK